MMNIMQKRKWGLPFVLLLLVFLLSGYPGVPTTWQRVKKKSNGDGEPSYPPVRLHVLKKHMVLDNGILKLTLSSLGGQITGLQYNGIDNLLQHRYPENKRGYWDIYWSRHGHPLKNKFDKLKGTKVNIVKQEEDQIELSFVKEWNSSSHKRGLPLNIDKRFILLRGCFGFYSYAIFERPEGWPALNIAQGRIAFKLEPSLFQYMAVSDDKQRIMPTTQDVHKGQTLDYPEAVLLTNPVNSFLRGEVDDKYQYSSDYKDHRVHGWICSKPRTGFWIITPSNEFKTAGPVKQDLTSHVGPTALSMFFSEHYAGSPLILNFSEGEPWKKVFGPVFVYVNSVSHDEDPLTLWSDAKRQMLIETEKWPYDFPLSEDFLYADQRGALTGRLLVKDNFISKKLMNADSAYIGLAPPGDVGSWQRENKTRANRTGYFVIKNVRPGNYNLYAWVPGFIGDYKYNTPITIQPGKRIRLGNIIYHPPRNGPTLWEIGVLYRTTAEFFVPDPNRKLINPLYVHQGEKFRQYGLWNRYTDMYLEEDLVYTVGTSDYRRDWYFVHVNRNAGNKTYLPTIWKILFELTELLESGNYTLQLALASASEAELQVWINKEATTDFHFTTGLIGRDNAIKRHGIHGLYWLYNIDVPCSLLVRGSNTIFLTQSRATKAWNGIMYDYIRLEGPSYDVETLKH